ncbi:MAG: SPOR domain-containing protein [Kangiellaceae bacterium]|nr:SPOR domain-containing protein [Kangiellaceae bacterium]
MSISLPKNLSLSLIALSVAGLAACSSSPVKDANQEQSFWYCKPATSDDWSCADSPDGAEQDSQWLTHRRQQPEQSFSDAAQNEVIQAPQTVDVIADEAPISYQPETPPITDSIETVSSQTDIVVESQLEAKPENDTVETEISSQQSIDQLQVSDNKAHFLAEPWLIQLAAYSTRQNAEKLSQQVYQSQIVETYVNGRQFYNVIIASFATRGDAEQASWQLQQQLPDVKPWIRSSESLRKILLD